MNDLTPFLTLPNIMFVIGILGAIFTAFNFFRNPQIALDKQQAVNEAGDKGKAAVLAQQLQWEKDSNERRFGELRDALNSTNATATNHVAHMDVKIDTLITSMSEMKLDFSNKLTELRTIIDERVPLR